MICLLQDLLSFIKREDIRNVIVISADVHYPAVVEYSPERATFKDFNPFIEVVTGPSHSGGFGVLDLDPSFGPKVRHPHSEHTLAFNPPYAPRIPCTTVSAEFDWMTAVRLCPGSSRCQHPPSRG